MPIEKTCIDNSKISWSYHDNIKGLNLHLKSFNTSYGEYKKKTKMFYPEKIGLRILTG